MGRWIVVRGHIDWGETIEGAVVREVKEELGVKVKYEGLISIKEGVFPKEFSSEKHFIYL